MRRDAYGVGYGGLDDYNGSNDGYGFGLDLEEECLITDTGIVALLSRAQQDTVHMCGLRYRATDNETCMDYLTELLRMTFIIFFHCSILREYTLKLVLMAE
ncbi:heterogeneous nuclear ribonucleoprotein H-like isoform X4 [Macaca fascicularis]|uniref:heterogeneous nuclear ribonucleoprotein H-like isoform X4 n=1 Tax=Macaca fascicularis TaxID=9541 RepID=UPI003D15D2DD